MADTHIEINGKCVGEYDICDKPCVKFVNGSGPDDCGNVKVDGGGPTINGGYDTVELVTLTDETVTSGELLTNSTPVWNFIYDKVGKEVTVVFDGIPYQCVIKDTSGRPPYVIGDTNFVECPFCIRANVNIDADPMQQVCLYTTSTGESHTVKIQGYESTPVVFDKKYIPDMTTLTNPMSLDSVNATRAYGIDKNGKVGWVNCDVNSDIMAPIRFYNRDGVYTKNTDRSYDSVASLVGSYYDRVVATCVVLTSGNNYYEKETYFASRIRRYYSGVKGLCFKFVSLVDSSGLSTFNLFWKPDDTIVEGDPNQK